jgi:hypothetical protein
MGVQGESWSPLGFGGLFGNTNSAGTALAAIDTTGQPTFLVKATGNVGIGTNTPGFPLHLRKSDATATGLQARVTNTSTTAHSFATYSLEANNGVLVSQFVADGLGTGPLGTVSAYLGTFTNHPLGLVTSNTERLRITTGGRVGIGVTAPASTLDVAGNNFQAARFANTATSGDRTAIVDIMNGDNVTWRQAVGGVNNGLGLTAGQFYLERSGGGAKLVVDTAGNVSIGTTVVNARLRVESGAGTTTIRAVQSGSNDQAVQAWNLSGSGDAIALYGNTASPTGYALYTDGNARVVGNISTTGCVAYNGGSVGVCSSDARLKENVRSVPAVLDRLVQLQPVHFDWRRGEFPERSFPAGPQPGLIAQQVEQVMPELVVVGEDGFRQVRYGELPMLTLEAIRELKAENDALRAELEALKAQRGEVSELREMLMSLQRQLGSQVSKAVVSGQ